MTAEEKIQFRKVVLFLISFLIFTLDQLAKYFFDTNLNLGQPVTVFPGFDLLLAYNSGAAFSFLSDAGGWQRWVLTVFSSVISVFLIIWIARLPKQEKLTAIALCLILGGALGNLYDRAVNGYVIDFISLYFHNYRFAIFNIADSSVFLGACLMILNIFKNRPEETNPSNSLDLAKNKSIKNLDE